MSPLPQYPLLKKPEDPVVKSVSNPNAFAKPGSMGKTGKTAQPNVRFRPLSAKRPGRLRKRKRDPRQVRFY